MFVLCGPDLTHTTGLHVPVDAGVAAASSMTPPDAATGAAARRVVAVDLGATSGG